MITKKEAMKDYYDEGYSHGYVDGYKKAELDYPEEMKKRKRKTGHWENNKCDVCGASRPPLFDYYCPNCGAEMRGDKE